MSMNVQKPIVCCGFTPCIQRILEYAVLNKGEVNRAVKLTVGIGGKGANTARMVNQLGAESLLLGFAGGANGLLLERMLDEQQVKYKHVQVSGETRICQTLVEEGNPESTELVEEMVPLMPDEWEAMLRLIDSLDLAGAVVPMAGKLAPGAPEDAYAQVAERVHRQGGRIILDAPGAPMLRTLPHRPFIVKINDVELLQTFGATRGDVDTLVMCCRRLIDQGAVSVLITRGSRSAFFVDSDQVLEIFPPKIMAVNAVGSGDAVTAGLATELQQGRSMVEAVRTGMACGAANALNLISGLIKLEDKERFRLEVRVDTH